MSDGFFAEYAIVDARLCAELSDKMTFQQVRSSGYNEQSHAEPIGGTAHLRRYDHLRIHQDRQPQTRRDHWYQWTRRSRASGRTTR
jgi:hypothetical protein